MFDFSKSEWDILYEECEFTDTEKELLQYIRRGWSDIRIQIELGISNSTYYRIKKKIRKKLQKGIDKLS